MKKRKICVLLLACLLVIPFSGCGDKPNPNSPVTLTLWHTYDQQMMESIDELINEFNSTVGAREGIVVESAFIAVAAELHEKLLSAAEGLPGAPALPDIAVVYPRAAVTLAEKGLLMDIGSQFNNEELSRYVPSFIEEGKLGGDTLYVLPVAKSTEVLYVNTTIFDRFSKETGVQLSQLAGFEGILDAAETYYAWTDAKTPDIAGDGKAFFYPEDLFNYAIIGFAQLGGDFVAGRSLNLESPIFRKIWDSYFPYAVKGGVAIFDKYANYLARTGDIVCTASTTASVTFYAGTVTYADNTKEDADFAILPYPVFEGGEKIAMQRGGGMCVFKSDAKREYAAGVFLNWLTGPEQNLRFTANMGYLPVTQEAYNELLTRETEPGYSENVKKLLETVIAMQKDYTFYYPPVFDGFEALQKKYKEKLLEAAENSRRTYLGMTDFQDYGKAYEEATAGVYEKFAAVINE